jgi:serine/threonine-protein kinase
MFGRYADPEWLGQGGMAVVYKARHPTLNHFVAIKVLPPHLVASESARKRFVREGQTIAHLKHPNIVGIHDFGEWEGEPYMVMEYIAGRTLGEIIEADAPLPLERIHSITKDIADALDYAHSQGLIHRDVKPSNVMLESTADSDPFKQSERVVLMDFGIARLVTAETMLTGSGVVGTFAYIAPEQIRAVEDIDGRADIYALGVMVYEMLTGELPFKAANPAALLIAHLQQPAPDPCEVHSGVSPKSAAAVLRALQKDPSHRFATAGELAQALQ